MPQSASSSQLGSDVCQGATGAVHQHCLKVGIVMVMPPCCERCSACLGLLGEMISTFKPDIFTSVIVTSHAQSKDFFENFGPNVRF